MAVIATDWGPRMTALERPRKKDVSYKHVLSLERAPHNKKPATNLMGFDCGV
jgi:hypothetical protein